MIKRVVCWLLVMLIGLTGCQKSEAPETSRPKTGPEESRSEAGPEENQEDSQESRLLTPPEEEKTLTPTEGGQLCLAIENPTSLLPWEVTDEATGKLLMLICSPLMNQRADGSMLPCLAVSRSWSEDLTELTIRLREGVTFHNGKTLGAEDVVYTIEKLRSTPNVYSDAVAGIAQVEALEEGRVLLRFAAPGRMNEESLIFPIVPEGYEEALVPMGTGPYAYREAETMREMHLQRFEAYFGERPYIPEVKVYFVRDKAAVEQSFGTTRTNLMQTDYFAWGTYVNQKNLTVHPFESYEAVYLEFDTKGTFGRAFSNREKAVLAVDAVRVLRDAYWGKGQVTETLVRPGSWYQSEAVKPYGYDAEKAANMASVGSSKVRLLYDGSDPLQQAAAETIRTELEAAGLSVTLKTSGAYDIALRRSRMTLMEAARTVNRPELLAGAETDEEVKQAAAELSEQMSRELTVYNLFFLTQGTVTGYGIEGELTPGDRNVYGGVEGLYMPDAVE